MFQGNLFQTNLAVAVADKIAATSTRLFRLSLTTSSAKGSSKPRVHPTSNLARLHAARKRRAKFTNGAPPVRTVPKTVQKMHHAAQLVPVGLASLAAPAAQAHAQTRKAGSPVDVLALALPLLPQAEVASAPTLDAIQKQTIQNGVL